MSIIINQYQVKSKSNQIKSGQNQINHYQSTLPEDVVSMKVIACP